MSPARQEHHSPGLLCSVSTNGCNELSSHVNQQAHFHFTRFPAFAASELKVGFDHLPFLTSQSFAPCHLESDSQRRHHHHRTTSSLTSDLTMAPPKSYAEIVQGARRGPPPAAPPLPVLYPSTSSSRTVEVATVAAEQQQQQPQPRSQPQSQPQSGVGATGTSRSYASAVKGSHSKFSASFDSTKATSRRHHTLNYFLSFQH